MNHFIGILFFFGLLKKVKKLFKDKKSTIRILIGAIVLRNFAVLDIPIDPYLMDIISGLLEGAIIMAGYTLLTGKYYQPQEQKKANKKQDTQKKWGDLPPEWDNTPPKKTLPKVTKPKIAQVAPQNSSSKATAVAAAKKYLKLRNHRIHDDLKKVYDFIAVNSRGEEIMVTVVAVEHKSNNAVISFTKDKFATISALGRAHRLFIVTDCQQDQDAQYLGNYVTLYALDSDLEDTGFVPQGNSYHNTLRKLKKYSYDQEISVRQEDLA